MAADVSDSVADPVAPGARLNVDGETLPTQPEGTTPASEKVLVAQYALSLFASDTAYDSLPPTLPL